MKKIFSFIIALAMTITLASAQTKTVEHSKWYENTSVTLLGGATTTGQMMDVPAPFFWDGTKAVFSGVKPFTGIEVTKYFTPVVGASVEALGFIGTTTSYTFFDESALLANGKVNISNLFGYKGQPRRVEVVAVAGLGWGHDYVNGSAQTWSSYANGELEPVTGVNPYNTNAVLFTDKNYVVYNAAAELNVNLGKDRDWQVSVRPGVLWFNKYTAGNFQSLPTWKHDARANVQVGVTYKFGKAGKKNFRLCPYSVTQKDYDALKKQYNDLANKEPEVFVSKTDNPMDVLGIGANMVLSNQFHTEYHRVTLSHTKISIPRGFLMVESSKTAKQRCSENSSILKIFGRNLVESQR